MNVQHWFGPRPRKSHRSATRAARVGWSLPRARVEGCWRVGGARISGEAHRTGGLWTAHETRQALRGGSRGAGTRDQARRSRAVAALVGRCSPRRGTAAAATAQESPCRPPRLAAGSPPSEAGAGRPREQPDENPERPRGELRADVHVANKNCAVSSVSRAPDSRVCLECVPSPCRSRPARGARPLARRPHALTWRNLRYHSTVDSSHKSWGTTGGGVVPIARNDKSRAEL